MAKTTIKTSQEIEVKKLVVRADVRYWEDATINGEEDTAGTLTPCRSGNDWNPTIDLDSGVIENWPIGTIADIHFKVCDAGVYQLIDSNGNVAAEIDGYVPRIMCPQENGYGDYIIMKIDENGKIRKWKVSLSEFEEVED